MRRQRGADEGTGASSSGRLVNREQAAYWSGSGGQAWLASIHHVEPELEPLGIAAMSALEVRPGDAVLDVGCGTATTTLALARAVGPGGRVVGIDLSPALLEVGRRRLGGDDQLSAEGAGDREGARGPKGRRDGTTVLLLQADAQAEAPGAPFDAIYSRFGVMFFADPVAAFGTLRSATVPGGRLAFVCWQSIEQNPWFSVPAQAVSTTPGVPPPPPMPPGAPGPFAFGEADRVEQVLTTAGWRDVDIRPHRDELVLDEAAIEHRVQMALARAFPPPAPGASQESEEVRQLRRQASERARAAIAAQSEGGLARLSRAAWVVTAHS